MQRIFKPYQVESLEEFKNRTLQLSKQLEHFCLLESNNYDLYPYSNFGFFIAIDSLAVLEANPENYFFKDLLHFHQEQEDWLFGALSYELKNQVEPELSSKNFDGIQFPLAHFFVPKYLFRFYKDKLELGVTNEAHRQEFDALINNLPISNSTSPSLKPKARISESEYVTTVNKIKEHIQRGDIYETNFCQEFYVEDAAVDSVAVYQKLNQLAKAPFGAFFKRKEHSLMCSSPERYLKHRNNKVISQPIKGTIRRGENETADQLLKEALKWDPKERSENVMIVDLVRNDLSKIATKGSVKVEELFAIYTFEQVHQMISTVVAQIDISSDFSDVLEATFPMGSMTGAPKYRAMELMEDYEKVQRGLYSGAVGYITPTGNFDFNVVIRSILHNALNKYTSIQVGSAITIDCKAEYEYKECLLKARAMFEALATQVKSDA